MRVGILGAGSWGTALAKHLGDRGHDVVLWARSAERAQAIGAARENAAYLPGVRLPTRVVVTASVGDAVARAGLVVSVCPSHAVRGVAREAGRWLGGAVVVSASKGIEEGTLKTMTQVLAEVLPPGTAIAALSGPSFAREVASGMPTALTAAAPEARTASEIQQLFGSARLRVYTTTDVVGVELGGAVKNVIALAAGVSEGLGFGNNTRAALITRGLAEMMRLGERLGARAQTLAGLAGLGDLVLTCTGDLSRNRRVGLRLGRGERLEAILAGMREVAEGVRSTRSVRELARRLGVEMPITEQMHAVLYEEKAPLQAVVDLMGREPKPEF